MTRFNIEIIVSTPDLLRVDALGMASHLGSMVRNFGDSGIVVHEVRVEEQDA